jgi:hypothetical protein
MYRARWRERLGPPSILWGTAALIALAAAPATSSAFPEAALAAVPAPAAAPAGCASTPRTTARAAIQRQTARGISVRDRLTADGEFEGRSISLNLGLRGVLLELPIESFVAPRHGDALLYGRAFDDLSEIHLLDAASGCDQLVARLTGIARSAVLDPAGDSIYVHSVADGSRDDLGVVRHDLSGAPAQQVVPPLPPDERFGPTFGTTLRWSTDGASLAVQSCGFESCRTRILDVAQGSIQTYDAPGQGALVGLTPATLVAFGDCSGLPCPVLAIDRATGSQRVVANEAWSASLVATESGAELNILTAAGTIEVAI